MAPRSKTGSAATSNAPAKITANSQQSRFHTATLDTSLEIDLQDVSISIGDRDLITSSRLKLKEGVRYGLVGRNGSGKSTLLTAISEKIIPGIGERIKILLLSQVEDGLRASEGVEEDISVLNHVVRGDKERTKAMNEMDALTTALESASLVDTSRIVLEIKLQKAREHLEYARKIAARRSGTRGKEARLAEIKAEEDVKLAEEKLNEVGGASWTPESTTQTDALDLQTSCQLTLDLLEGASAVSRASQILAGLGFSQEMMDGPYKMLSGGWRSRCSLAVSLLVKSDLLLLDEPSNFLDLEAILWLEQHLTTSPSLASCTLVLISHDLSFLNAVVEETIVLRNNSLKYFEGTPRAFEVNERKERKKTMVQVEALGKKKEHIEKSIQQGIASAKKTGDENRQRMVKSRQKKLDERWGLETSAKGGRFKLNRDMVGYFNTNRSELTLEELDNRVKIRIEDPAELRTKGDLVTFDKVGYGWKVAGKTDKKFLLQDVSFSVEQGGRCALIGANGQGKSTLAKLILGAITPTTGTITRHPLLTIGYFSQHSVEDLSLPLTHTTNSPTDGIDKPTTALNYFLNHFNVVKGDKVSEQEARSCLGLWGLQGKVASESRLGMLSGGQKVRLALSLIVFRPPPLLLLDEISTHLDAASILSLANALRSFSGGIILITHDRLFSRIVIEGGSYRSILVSEGAEDDESEESESDSDDEGAPRKIGKTYRVGGGKIKEMEKGMKGYVGIVERKLEKRRREAEAASSRA